MKKMRRLYRIGALVGAILLPIGAVLATGIPEASAASAASSAAPSGNQFCYYNDGFACLNAWNGGPWVNVYTGGFNTHNNDFTVYASADFAVELVDTGGNAWSGKCIGDAYNKPGYADASLDPCGSPWGTDFIEETTGCPPGEVAFYNIYWAGYLGPKDLTAPVNGSHFYLNKPQKVCFVKSNAVSG